MKNEIKEFIDYVLETDIKKIHVKYDGIDINFSRHDTNISRGITNTSYPSGFENNNVQNNLSGSTDIKLSVQASDAILVNSPMVGIVHYDEGITNSVVKMGQMILQIESMKVFSDVVAPQDGKIAKFLVPNNTAVEFDDPLFEMIESE